MELPAVGPTAINLTFSDGNVAPLTEAGARVFLAGLRAEIADAAQDGCDIAFELQDSTSSTEVTMSLGRARAFADDIKVMLSRFAAKGRPVGKIDQVTRDGAGHIVGIETSFQY